MTKKSRIFFLNIWTEYGPEKEKVNLLLICLLHLFLCQMLCLSSQPSRLFHLVLSPLTFIFLQLVTIRHCPFLVQKFSYTNIRRHLFIQCPQGWQHPCMLASWLERGSYSHGYSHKWRRKWVCWRPAVCSTCGSSCHGTPARTLRGQGRSPCGPWSHGQSVSWASTHGHPCCGQELLFVTALPQTWPREQPAALLFCEICQYVQETEGP